MKITVLFFILFVNHFFSQEQGNWTRFEDTKTYLIGYKDEYGKIMIKPKFTFLTNAIVFVNIIPVFEEINPKQAGNSKMKQYYLLKNGKQVGLDSLYVYDTTLDCENEKKIRFRDYKTDKVGFFDANGKTVIPAVYDDAKPFYNGFAVVITKGKRMCWNESGEFSQENHCEEWSWVGNIQLINDKNEIIAENIPLENLKALDWFSLKKNSDQTNLNYVTFKSTTGDTYSFLNYEKEFEYWFYIEFLKNVSKTSVFSYLFNEITIDINQKKQYYNSKIKFKDSYWKEGKKEIIFKENKDYIFKIVTDFKNTNSKTQIAEGTSPVLFRSENRKKYYTNCGEYQNIKFPYFQVYLLDSDSKVINTLGFIKSKSEYKLLEIF